ncbi:MAG TPA: hypothetical protein VHB79_06315 [Polyangiaceae bacterium]|nr:hypothetical protein [Polyangiaceae bacterium]
MLRIIDELTGVREMTAHASRGGEVGPAAVAEGPADGASSIGRTCGAVLRASTIDVSGGCGCK